MDPLSIVASIIGVVQAADRVVGVLSKIKTLINAPREIELLIHDVSGIRSVLQDLRETEKLLEFDKLGRDRLQTLHMYVEEGGDILLELERLIGEYLTETPTSESDRIKVHRLGWVRKVRQVEKLKMRMRDVKLSISVQLGSISLLASIDSKSAISQIVLQNGHLLAANKNLQQDILRHFEDHAASLIQTVQHTLPSSTDMLTPSPNNDVEKTPNRIISLNAMRERIRQRYACSQWCQCICHQQFSFRLPYLTSKNFGSFKFTVAGISGITPICNSSSCLTRSKAILKFDLHFPRWLLARIITVSMLFSQGPELLLRTLRVRSWHDSIFREVTRGQKEEVKMSLSRGRASVLDVDDDIHQSLLYHAVDWHQYDIAEILLSKGADPYQEDKTNNSPYAIAWETILLSQHSRSANRLRELFPESEAIESFQFSALHLIVLGRHKDDLEKVAEITPIDSIDARGRTALSWASQMGDVDKVDKLLHLGASVDLSDSEGFTPLHKAASSPSPMCIASLLKAGADINARSLVDLNTPLHSLARVKQSIEGLSLIISSVNNVNLDVTNKYGWTPLHFAIEHGCTEIIEHFIDNGADINARTYNPYGYSCIHVAIDYNNHSALTTLLQRGANILELDSDGQTILQHAARWADFETLQILKTANLRDLRVDNRSRDGRTALDIAESEPFEDSPEWLAAFVSLLESVMEGVEEDIEKGVSEGKTYLYSEAQDDDVFEDALEFHQDGIPEPS